MKIRDLRVGNLILFAEDSTIFEVTEISEYGVNVKNEEEETYIEIDSFEGIGITEDWLIKFGFKKDENKGFDSYFYSKGIFYLFHEKDFDSGFTFPILMKYGNINEYKNGRHIKYVHELQNLYFAIQQKELVMKDIIVG